MHPNETLRDLLRRVGERDDSAAETLFHSYQPFLLRLIRLRLTDPKLRRLVDSSDLSNSVLTDFFRLACAGMVNLNDPGQLRQWFRTMVRNKISKRARDNKRICRDHRRLQQDAWEELLAIPDTGANPSEIVANRDYLEKLKSLLTAEDRELLELYEKEVPWSEIAMGRTKSSEALRKQLARALQEAARELGDEEFES
jgi:RNA polymerase sigma factor (sigma-70 family)